MPLKVDFRQFFDDEGNQLDLTEQAKMVFNFLAKVVSSVSENIDQPLVDVDLKCNTRANKISCEGYIDAKCTVIGIIDWHCDTCEASGIISNWQRSQWDKQKRTLH